MAEAPSCCCETGSLDRYSRKRSNMFTARLATMYRTEGEECWMPWEKTFRVKVGGRRHRRRPFNARSGSLGSGGIAVIVKSAHRNQMLRKKSGGGRGSVETVRLRR